MKHLFRTLILLQAIGCSTGNPEYNYIKVFGIERALHVTAYNKGLSINNYLYYNPTNDSAFLRYGQYWNDSLISYTGSFKEFGYADTLSTLMSYLKYASGEKGSVLSDLSHKGIISDGFLIEYKDSKGIHYKVFDAEHTGDTLRRVSYLIHRLESSSWNKSKISNQYFNDTAEVVNFLKGLGIYDSLFKPYIPLPCVSGIDMKKLFGNWRSIGDRDNDHTLKYWINRINKNGDWIIEKMDNGDLKPKYFGRIKIIGKNNSIIVKSNQGETILEILNLTENCLEYRHKESKQIWRFDRMQ